MRRRAEVASGGGGSGIPVAAILQTGARVVIGDVRGTVRSVKPGESFVVVVPTLPAAFGSTGQLAVRFARSGDAAYRLETALTSLDSDDTGLLLHAAWPSTAERIESRRHPRAPLCVEVELGRPGPRRLRTAPPTLPRALTLDVSGNGLALVSDEELDQDSTVLVIAERATAGRVLPARARASVVRRERQPERVEAHGRYRYGLELVDLDREEVEQLCAAVERLSRRRHGEATAPR